MLGAIYERLVAAEIGLRATWVDEVTQFGKEVKLFRDYHEGDHEAKLTPEMQEMLRISGEGLDQFNMNYCELVVDMMVDRLTVAGITADTEQGTQWGEEVLDFNRFDGLHVDVDEAAVRDGVTFVMVAFDNDEQKPIFAHEPAWDGDTGMIPVYDRGGKQIVAAVKVWYETGEERRVNIYYADRIEKYTADTMSITPRNDETTQQPVLDWKDRDVPLGVPVVPVFNKAKAKRSYGRSELIKVIPLQNVINRTLYSLVAAEELSAFQIKVARGFRPPPKVAPGMVITIGEEGLSKDQIADMSVLEQALLVPFISMLQFLVDQIGAVSQTPLPGQMGGDSSSGEALKQREIGLLGKVKRFQVKGGNAWEDVMKMAVAVQNAFGKSNPPPVKRWTCHWEDADIRNDAEVIKNAKEMRETVGDREFLRLVAPVWGYDQQKIDAIMAEKAQQQALALASLPLPGFDNFTVQ